ncbi:MAG TPA: D-alanine--D-alanine ligase family protein [Solirubrobacteraceae bacterium]|jgi:D-alanine-D-alanine ligase|nr:D-alanine--D-alanine ligase family protein [Solirubrobacteraceae bacterium]
MTLTVALLAGGRSSEHDVSLASARAVREGLECAGHEVRWVEIERDGAWLHGKERLSLCPGEGLLAADVVFPALHGPFGEDGTVQGVLESLDVAYVGAGVAASAICMDKVLFKELMSAAGIPQVGYAGVRAERWRRAPAEVLEELAALGLPVFVKPAHMGSSVGIVKVSDAHLLDSALDQAFTHDPLAIVEALASGVEVECAVLGSSRNDDRPSALASEPGEIAFAGEWYDYAAKYDAGGMELLVPARISAAACVRVRELALEVFAYTGCEGLARVDFFVDGERVLVNELNTMPGFTPTSVYAKLIEASGIPYPELVDRLCRLGIERWEARRAYQY